MLAEQCLTQSFEHPKLLQMRAIGHERQGRLAEAQNDLERAHDLNPEDAGIAIALGILLVRQGHEDRATGLFEAQVAKTPAIPALHFHLGVAFMGKGDHARARLCFEQVVKLDPNAGEALGKLAVIAAHRGDHGSAREQANKALALKPANQDARRALLEAAVDERQFAAAEHFARHWLAETDIGGARARMDALSLLGDALDGLGRPSDAYEAYSESKTIFRSLHGSERQGLRPLLQRMSAELNLIPPSVWTDVVDRQRSGPAAVHVFLLGFMRSGTTLLEQALSRHGGVANLEEREALAGGAHLLIQPGGMAALSRLSAEEADIYRASYWRSVREAGVDPDGKVFIDKLPFNGAKLPLIHKLFPDAKIILALRDPRDVVFSCFQRRLKPNAYSLELANLEDGAGLYDAYMSFVRTCRQKLPLDLMEHRHEDLVQDFRARIEEVCDFIGLAFTPEMAAFDAGAASDQVMSQSSRQLRSGLNSRGVGHWRAYRDALQPALPILEPWVEAYGYAPSTARQPASKA